jgi:hypothetical protein
MPDPHPIDIPDIVKLLGQISAGKDVGFHCPEQDRSEPAPFTIRGVEGGFVVKRPDGAHIGSFALLTLAWKAGVAATRR